MAHKTKEFRRVTADGVVDETVEQPTTLPPAQQKKPQFQRVDADGTVYPATPGVAGDTGTSQKPMTGGTTGTTGSTSKKPETFTYGKFNYGDFSYDPFAPSDLVQQAQALIQQQQAGRPGAYQPVWQDEADAYLSRYQNRDPFSYDVNSDALYNQYKDQYIQQGRMAMMDTMGQAAAMTGGYGSSYAQTVGQQAYNQQLGQLNNIVPELYQMAYDRYTQEGQDLLNMYGLYMDRENQEYGKYQDGLDNWYREMSRLTDDYNTQYDREYNEWAANRGLAYDEYAADRSLAYDSWAADREIAYDKYQSDINAALNAGSGTGDGKVSIEDDAYWVKQAERVRGDINAVDALANRMRAAGYSDAYIMALCNAAMSGDPGNAGDTTVEPITPTAAPVSAPETTYAADPSASEGAEETWWDKFLRYLSGAGASGDTSLPVWH